MAAGKIANGAIGKANCYRDMMLPEDMDDNDVLRIFVGLLRRRPQLQERLLARLSAPVEYEDLVAGPIASLRTSGITLLVGLEWSWKNPHIHCRAGQQSPWTSPPGLGIKPSQVTGFKQPSGSSRATWFATYFPNARFLEFVLNDGKQHWEKAAKGTNFQAQAEGVWVVFRGKCQIYAEMLAEEAEIEAEAARKAAEVAAAREKALAAREKAAAKADAAWQKPAMIIPKIQAFPTTVTPVVSHVFDMAPTSGVAVVYHTSFKRPHLHYRAGPHAPWSELPGVPMLPSSMPGHPARGAHDSHGWWTICIPGAEKLEFVPNDENRHWDKAPGDQNYQIHGPGLWKVVAGRVELISDDIGAVEVAPNALQVSHQAAQAAQAMIAAEPSPRRNLLPPLAPSAFEFVSESLGELVAGNDLVILFRSSWAKPHIHCRDSPQAEWTPLPGIALPAASPPLAAELDLAVFGDNGLPSDRGNWFAATAPELEELEFVLNDGGPYYRWDKVNGGGNYGINKVGVWLVHMGRCELFEQRPPAPRSLQVAAVTRSTVTVTWTSTPGRLRGYRIFRDGKRIGVVSSGTLQFVDTGVVAAREFNYQVAALSHQGLQSELSSPVMAKTDPPGPPGRSAGLKCIAATAAFIKLEWTAPQETGGAPITAYRLLRDGQYLTTVPSEEAKVQYVDDEVKKGQLYSYAVIACHLPREGKLREQIMTARQRTLCPEEHDPLANGISDDINEGPAVGPVEVEAADDLEPDVCLPDLAEQMQQKGITIFYRSEWSAVYMHCVARAQMGWTKTPGLKLEDSPTLSLPASEGWKVIYLPSARNLELVMNNGSDKWDKAPGGRNFAVDVPGTYRVANAQLERLTMPPAAPVALKGDAGDGSRTDMVWRPPPVSVNDAPIVSYKVLRNGIVVGIVEHFHGAEVEGLHYMDKNLFAFTNYEYAVAAVNRQGVTGALTAPISIQTLLPGPPTAPEQLRGAVCKYGDVLAITLEWEPPEDCGGAPVVSYNILRDGILVGYHEVTAEQLQSETECGQPQEAMTTSGIRWCRSTTSYSNLAWFKDSLSWIDCNVQVGQDYAYQVQAVQLGTDRADELRSFRRCGSAFLDSLSSDIEGPPCDPCVIKAAPFLDPPTLGEQCHRVIFQGFDWGSHKANSWWNVLQSLLPEFRSAGLNMVWLPPVSDSVDSHGYLPRQWYNLDSKYGSASELQRLVCSMHEQGIVPMLDVVVNHRCAAKQDHSGRWLVFEQPDWGDWAICSNSPSIQGSGRHVSGEEAAQYAPCVDHSNSQVQQDVKDFIRYMMDEVGFKALRFDFVKGYAPQYQVDYVKAVGSPFAVAENWNGGADGLHHYIHQCQGKMAVFDFPLYYVLKRCIHSNHFSDLSEGGRPCGILGRDPARSCTFVDNHDTSQLAIVGGAFGNNEQVLRAYAYILTHPGVPTVFHGDYVRSSYVRERILELCAIRRDCGVHSTSRVDICRAEGGLYAAVIHQRLAVKIGTNDWSPGGGWQVASLGTEFCVWTRV
mmetsp:Transcript_48119/g.112510  ORF Transcript_48119/g.112510 Transcript_48119/m.112510 type:complete len:1507 (-) Transcript_48119:36-4556(-)